MEIMNILKGIMYIIWSGVGITIIGMSGYYFWIMKDFYRDLFPKKEKKEENRLELVK